VGHPNPTIPCDERVRPSRRDCGRQAFFAGQSRGSDFDLLGACHVHPAKCFEIDSAGRAPCPAAAILRRIQESFTAAAATCVVVQLHRVGDWHAPPSVSWKKNKRAVSRMIGRKTGAAYWAFPAAP